MDPVLDRLNLPRQGDSECSAGPQARNEIPTEKACLPMRPQARWWMSREAPETTATQFLDTVYFLAHWNIIRLPFTLRTSTLVTLRR